ncbi:21105_t:CDS:1, partial [Racocetra persica]
TFQEIVFPLNHPDEKKRGHYFLNSFWLTERGIWDKRLRGKCVKYVKDETKICCNKRKLARQLDFMEQKNVLEEI